MTHEANTGRSPVTPEEEFRIQLAVKDRLIDYWWDVDRNAAKCAVEFYTEDCVYLMCDYRMEGHAAIRSYYEYRESRGDRLVRHVVTNLRVHVKAVDQASLDGVLCVYAADGVPVLPSAPPIMIADTECTFVKGSDGHWRFKLHQIIPLFRGGVEVLVPPQTPRS